MKKRIFHIVVFVVFLVAGFIYLNKVFLTEHHYFNTTEEFKKLSKESEFDVMFYGSSRSYRTFNPLVFDYYSKSLSFNLGSDGLRMPFTSMVLEESLKYNKPTVAVFEIHSEAIKYPKTEEAKGFQLRALDFVSNFSFNKFIQIKETYDFEEFLSVYSPLIRNHSNWNEVDYNHLSRKAEVSGFFNRGYFGDAVILDQPDKEKFKDFNTITLKKVKTKKAITAKERREIARFVKIANKNGVAVIIVSAPSLRTPYQNNTFYEELEEICSSLNVQYLNFNKHFSEADLKLIDFQDPGHLNIYGSIKTTKYLAKFINENYSLADKSKHENWKKINKELKPFQHLYFDLEESIFTQRKEYLLKEQAIIDSVRIVKNRRNHKLSLYLQDFNTFKKELDKYKLGVHIFPVEEEKKLLNERSIKEGWDFEIADFRLKGQEEKIHFQFNTNIKKIDRIEMFLYNETGFKGIIGNKITVSDIIFEENRDY